MPFMISRTINLLTQFSIPLIVGVVLALVGVHVFGEDVYRSYLERPLLGEDTKILGHPLTFYFLINDIFMVFFFGIAAVEITQSVLPGGSLNPISRAINPLFGTFGGVFGPAVVYFFLCFVFNVEASVYRGWGIPTATDIALAWLVARLIFGRAHPAVSFLLLVAIVDDAIGLGIIAIFYPDPVHPVEPLWLLLIGAGMLVAFALNRLHVKDFWWYLLLGGIPSWLGLILAHLHPALALVFIVPFMPAGFGRHKELFADEPETTTLAGFEHFFKTPVELGLLGFGLVNTVVTFSGISVVTWIVFFSLFIGKTLGISLFSGIAHLLGIHLAQGMKIKDLVIVSMIAGIGLTVALFVAGEAFVDLDLQAAAKMGALLSSFIVLPAILLGKWLNVERKETDK